MKLNKLIYLVAFSPLLFSCSEDIMDEINKDVNNPKDVEATLLITDVGLKTAFETTGTDIAWYSSVYVEHNAGTWGQHFEADTRVGQTSNSLMNNSWNNLYDVIRTLKLIVAKTDYQTGSEPDNRWARGIAQTLLAYNLAVATDMWGEVPYEEAGLGLAVLKPRYEKQSTLYPKIIALLDSAVYNLNRSTVGQPAVDLIYGGTFANNKASWIRAANSLKARYWMRLSNRNANAATNALAAITAGAFTTATQQMQFAKYEATSVGENPWYQFLFDRTHLSPSRNLDSLMLDRADPRRALYFTTTNHSAFFGNGKASQCQGCGPLSAITYSTAGRIAPTPLMTYHELLFIKAEAEYLNSVATWQATLQSAIQAAFVYRGSTTAAADAYYTAQVAPRLVAPNQHREIITQKFIALFEHEAIEAYNDYRRTGYPTMTNPFNATTGFVNRFPWALSETQSNPDNVPVADLDYVYTTKVWWAGGTELIP